MPEWKVPFHSEHPPRRLADSIAAHLNVRNGWKADVSIKAKRRDFATGNQ